MFEPLFQSCCSRVHRSRIHLQRSNVSTQSVNVHNCSLLAKIIFWQVPSNHYVHRKKTWNWWTFPTSIPTMDDLSMRPTIRHCYDICIMFKKHQLFARCLNSMVRCIITFIVFAAFGYSYRNYHIVDVLVVMKHNAW